MLLQPVTRELLDIGRRYAAMEAEVARLSQQSAELQGKPPLFLLLTFFCRTVPYCVLSIESLARTQCEGDDATLQSAGLKGKLDSTKADARVRVDEAVRAAR